MPAYRSALPFNLPFNFCQCLVIAGLVVVVAFSCNHFGDNCFCCFWRVRTPLKITPFYGLKELLLSFYGLRKVRYMLTICAICLPVLLVVSLPYQWYSVAVWGNGWACCLGYLLGNKKGQA